MSQPTDDVDSLITQYRRKVASMEELADEIKPLQDKLSKYFEHLPELQGKLDPLDLALDVDGKAPAGATWVCDSEHFDDPERIQLQLDGYQYYGRIVDPHYIPEEDRVDANFEDLYVSSNYFSSTEKRFLSRVKGVREGIAWRKESILRNLEELDGIKVEAAVENSQLPEEEHQETLDKLRALVGETPAAEPQFVVDDTKNYMSFSFAGRPYDVGLPQGKGIKLLHEEGIAGRPDVPEEDIKKVMGLSPTSDPRDSFRRTGLWKTLIVQKKRKTRRLKFFS